MLIQYLSLGNANLGPHFLLYMKNNPFPALELLSHKLSPNYSCHSTPEEFLYFSICVAHIYYHLTFWMAQEGISGLQYNSWGQNAWWNSITLYQPINEKSQILNFHEIWNHLVMDVLFKSPALRKCKYLRYYCFNKSWFLYPQVTDEVKCHAKVMESIGMKATAGSSSSKPPISPMEVIS